MILPTHCSFELGLSFGDSVGRPPSQPLSQTLRYILVAMQSAIWTVSGMASSVTMKNGHTEPDYNSDRRAESRGILAVL